MSLGNWHGVSPNTAHQEWSYWRFEIQEAGRQQSRKDVELNAARWLRKGFGTVGEAKITATLEGWRIEARVDGESAADPIYVQSVRRGFERFVRQGWGLGALGRLAECRVLAGDVAVGPRSQMIVMPSILPTDKL
ncbi:MAG TPA: hypothetical protein VFX15_04760 [Actinomycetes bacterium]|nr:hypothetical protein [Actinomycetes bacterium]